MITDGRENSGCHALAPWDRFVPENVQIGTPTRDPAATDNVWAFLRFSGYKPR